MITKLFRPKFLAEKKFGGKNNSSLEEKKLTKKN